MMHKKTKPTKKMMAGGMMKKGYAAGGAMPMKDGKPAFIGDGKGKMAAGGMAKKGYQAGGVMDEEEMMGRMGRGAKAKWKTWVVEWRRPPCRRNEAGMPQRRMRWYR
jgi:hypothetical protein